MLRDTALGRASNGKGGYITKVHQMQAAVMVHWESSDVDEEAGWFVAIMFCYTLQINSRLTHIQCFCESDSGIGRAPKEIITWNYIKRYDNLFILAWISD
jgi:hypothetical protein